MATVRKPSSLAARKMRMAISLRLAASSLRIGLLFLISEAVNASRQILHCRTEQPRHSWSFSLYWNKVSNAAARIAVFQSFEDVKSPVIPGRTNKDPFTGRPTDLALLVDIGYIPARAISWYIVSHPV